jgi:hypothetical protein
MTLAAAAPLTPGEAASGTMSSPNPAAHPAQDAAAGLAGIRVLGSGQGASGHAQP